METLESKASAATETSQQTKTPGYRLVIRARILPDAAAQSTAPKFSNKHVLATAVAVVAALGLGWLGFANLRHDESPITPVQTAQQTATAESTRAAADVVPSEPEQASAPAAPPTARSNETQSATESQQAQTPTPSPIDEVVPSPPQSALQTIRGTVRVAVRVTIANDGTVAEAVSEEPGPSRYFERLSLEAARKWTFTPPGTTSERPTMLLRFAFTREGASASAVES